MGDRVNNNQHGGMHSSSIVRESQLLQIKSNILLISDQSVNSSLSVWVHCKKQIMGDDCTLPIQNIFDNHGLQNLILYPIGYLMSILYRTLH